MNEIIEIPKTAIITNINESEIKIGNFIKIKIHIKELTRDERDYMDDVPQKREISILWFGNLLSAIVENKTKSDDEYIIDLRILYNYIALPKSFFPRTLILQFLATENQREIMTYKCQIFDITNNI